MLECVVPGGFYGFGCERDGARIPDGSAFLGYVRADELEFTLPATVATLRFHIATTSPSGPWTLDVEALDVRGEPVDATSVTVELFDEWPTTVVTLSAPGRQISRIRMTRNAAVSGSLLLDHVSWE